MAINDSNDSAPAVSPKPLRTRQVSSRFLSHSLNGPPKSGSASPSDSPRRARRSSVSTLSGQIGKERVRDREDHHLQDHPLNQKPGNKTPPPTPTPTTMASSVFSKQRSSREFSNSENNSKENDQPTIGRSGRFNFLGKASSLGKKLNSGNSGDVPGRMSLDGKALSASDDSLMMRKIINRKAMSSPSSPLPGYMSSKSQWALSPGRSGTPPMSVQSKKKPLSFSSLKPSNKGVEKILNMGLDLFRSKKSSSAASSEAFHQLRLLENQLLQWRFANAKANAVNDSIARQAESNLTSAVDSLAKLRQSVMQKRIQLERGKLEMKLNSVLNSQMKLSEAWEGMERQHMEAITAMKESLYSAACKVPLLEGAKVDIQLASNSLRHASDLLDSIKSELSSFSLLAEKNAELISELAKVVVQEKMLVQEFSDLSQAIRALEIEEKSLMCGVTQLGS